MLPIHVWKDVAQLKPWQYTNSIIERLLSIHVWKDVAQLKHYLCFVIHPESYRSIHVWKDVAQLKPRLLNFLFITQGFYPCLKGRGPIETTIQSSIHFFSFQLSMSEKTWPNWNASICCLVKIWNISIHVWRDVAQLKQRPVNSFAEPVIYPCLKGRGPIETRSLLCNSRIRCPIHVWKDMAQLKHVPRSCHMLDQLPIHVWRDVAQLKRLVTAFSGEFTRSIHVWRDVAQLKRHNISIILGAPERLSMSGKTWPNWNTKVSCLPSKYVSPIHVWEDVAQLKQHQMTSLTNFQILSMSEKTWPNWNLSRPFFLFRS